MNKINFPMSFKTKSIRPFIGSTNFTISRHFYLDLGFTEYPLGTTLSYFEMGTTGFYLQDAFVADWINNTMVFVEVDNVDAFWKSLLALDLPAKYPTAKIVPIRIQDWGKECFVHDPSGVLWHFGTFTAI
jgi:hypothetical protein